MGVLNANEAAEIARAEARNVGLSPVYDRRIGGQDYAEIIQREDELELFIEVLDNRKIKNYCEKMMEALSGTNCNFIVIRAWKTGYKCFLQAMIKKV